MESDEIRTVDAAAQLDDVLALPLALLYKHSTRCGTSLRAMAVVERFARSRRDIPVYGIDVTRQRAISLEVAERLDIEHQSPQVILLQYGQPAWHASHYHISDEKLTAAVGDWTSDKVSD
jgi:bacillithiol system protein YtxJ